MAITKEEWKWTSTDPEYGLRSNSGQVDSFHASFSRNAPRRIKPKGDLRLHPTAFSLYKEYGRLSAAVVMHRSEYDVGSPTLRVNTYVGAVNGSGYAYPGILSHRVNYDRVSNKLLTKLKAQNVNLGQLWGERAQTQRLFTSVTASILSSYRALRRGQLGKAIGQLTGLGVHRNRRMLHEFLAKNNRAAAERWLEFQYGIRPLIGDLYGSLDELVRKERTGAYTFMVSANSKEKSEEIYRWSANYLTEYDWMRRYCERIDSIRSEIFFRKPHVVISDLTSVGVMNPAVILWELTPWSFVVDWLLPVGSYLSALDATRGLQFVSGFSTRRSVRKVQSVFEGMGPYASDRRFKGAMTAVMYPHSGFQKRVSRDIISEFPMPVLRWKNPLSTTHVLNAMALLATAKRSPVR